MSAIKPVQKAAASTTPAVAPAGSLPAGKTIQPAQAVESGADAEEITASDVLAALGSLSEAPEADEPTATTVPAASKDADETEVAEETESATAEEPAAEETAESGEAAAESGDDAAEPPGDVEEPDQPEADVPATEGATPTQKRINELVARAKTAEESLAQKAERLAAVEASMTNRTDTAALEVVDSPEALAKKRSEILTLRRQLFSNPNGIELTVGGQAKQYDADGVADLLGQTDYLLMEALPEREKYLHARDNYEKAAAEAYPWLKDTQQGAGAQVHQVLQSNPNLRKIGPNYRLVAADAQVGQALREAGVPVTPQLIAKLKQEAGVTKPKPKPVVPKRTPPPAPARAGVMPPRATQRSAQSAGANKRLSKGDGNVNDIAASIAANW